jgi:hypothetical protein
MSKENINSQHTTEAVTATAARSDAVTTAVA